MSDLAPLKRAELNLLVEFHSAGGSGKLDVACRVIAGVPPSPLKGDSLTTWMRLMARGLIAGEDDVVMVTERGRNEAQRVIAGRTRESV